MVFKRMQSTLRRRGFTLTELAIVLGVVGIIIGGIWSAAGNTNEARKESDALTELQIILQNMNNLFQGRTLSNCVGTNLTSCMITAQVIPSNYVDAAAPTTADHPGSKQKFMIFQIGANGTKTFRLSLYQVPYQACMNIMMQVTNCQPGQVGCPLQVYTTAFAIPSDTCLPSQKNCPSASPTYTAGLGWSSITPTVASAMCGDNTTAKNSLEFDYSL